MEFATTKLVEPAQGVCSACQEQVTFDTVLVEIDHDWNKRNAMGHPRLILKQAHPMCDSCRVNPLWRDEPEPAREESPAARS